MVWLEVVLALFAFAVGLLAGITFKREHYTDKLEQMGEQNAELKKMLSDAKEELWPEVEAYVLEQLAQKREEEKRRFEVPIIQGVSYDETLVVIWRFRDLHRRGLPISYRRAYAFTSRGVYEKVRNAFIDMGYMLMGEQDWKPPYFTDRGLRFLDWFELRFGKEFRELDNREPKKEWA